VHPRAITRLGPADGVTVANGVLGFLAAAAAAVDLSLAARLLLLAAVADGLDGVLAERWGTTPIGEFLDSLSDAISFGVAPALFVLGAARAEIERSLLAPEPAALVLAVPALFVALAVVRLGLYTAYDVGRGVTEGVQTTLAATLLAAAYLAGVRAPIVLLGATLVLSGLMVAPLAYPDLRARDALAMGSVQALAIVAPAALARLFPRALFVAGLAYLALAPRYYPRAGEGKRT
jgi:CDP-diacylglycerol--serine O-phosphatidyltransferase